MSTESASTTLPSQPGGTAAKRLHALRVLHGVLQRELLRFLHQRERFIAALVRPLLWLVVFAAGFRNALGLSIIPPYSTYISYEVYVVPGLLGMILLFNGMQSSLSMVYDQEMGSMRVLLTAPMPRWYLLLCKLLAGVSVSLLQALSFLLIAWLIDIDLPWRGIILSIPALVLAGLMLGSLGILIASRVRQLENFAGIMNFVIFPMFFLSTALYPLWKMQESNTLLAHICAINPFSHAVELIRFALHGQFNVLAFCVVSLCALIFFVAASLSFNPARRFAIRRSVS